MSGWLLLLAVMAVAWTVSARKLRRQLAERDEEIAQLKEASGILESQLSRRGSRLDALLSSINEAVFRVDQGGRVLAANEWARNIFHISDRTPFPQSILVFYRDPDWRQEYQEALRQMPDASQLPDMFIGGKVLSPRIAPLGRDQALLLCMDITEKFKLENQRRTFIANLMHDLKTPLTSLLGYARSIQSFGDDADLRREAAQVIANEAKHVNHLLDALLTLDQIEYAGRDPEAHCHPESVLNLICDMLMQEAEEKGIKLTLQLPEMPPVLKIDADSLSRVMKNLIENAVRYSSPKSSVEVRLQATENRCVIEVADTGPGIPELHLPRVTERFYRVDKSRGRSAAGGHGLGLAIVRELLDAHGGSLQLTNRQPHGLIAKATIPVVSSRNRVSQASPSMPAEHSSRHRAA